MKIVSDDSGLDFQDVLEMGDGFLKEIVAFQIFEIADVLAEEGFVVADDANGVFQFTANGEDGL